MSVKEGFVELKRCVKCGGASVVQVLYAERQFKFYTRCIGCGFTTKDCDTIEEAKEYWNKYELATPIAEIGDELSELSETVNAQAADAEALLNDIFDMMGKK